jgi:hypothetical protein
VLLTAFAFSNAVKVNTQLGLLNQNYDLILWYFASIFEMILYCASLLIILFLGIAMVNLDDQYYYRYTYTLIQYVC